MKSNNALIVILGTVTLDAVGIGLVMPVAGPLAGYRPFRQHRQSLWRASALYALMQFLCAPVLGALSDRFGRRPVLLASLLGATIDYAIMATTPVLWILSTPDASWSASPAPQVRLLAPISPTSPMGKIGLATSGS